MTDRQRVNKMVTATDSKTVQIEITSFDDYASELAKRDEARTPEEREHLKHLSKAAGDDFDW